MPRDEYDPLMRVRGLPVFADRPDLRQLDAGDDLLGHDLESHWCGWRDAGRVTLEAGRDYDALVLGRFAGHGAAHMPRAARRRREVAIDGRSGVGTVATQAFQAWLRADERALGWRSPAATVTGCGEPFDTFGSLSQVLPFEDWPDDERPLTAASFCGTLPEAAIPAGIDPRDVVRSNAVRFLESRSRDALAWGGRRRRGVSMGSAVRR